MSLLIELETTEIWRLFSLLRSEFISSSLFVLQWDHCLFFQMLPLQRTFLAPISMDEKARMDSEKDVISASHISMDVASDRMTRRRKSDCEGLKFPWRRTQRKGDSFHFLLLVWPSLHPPSPHLCVCLTVTQCYTHTPHIFSVHSSGMPCSHTQPTACWVNM